MERYGPNAILVTSYSRAAAHELAGRDLPVDPDRVGTLHSHCFHALGGPEIAEANVEEWNRENPHLAITPVKRHARFDGEESAEDESDTTEKRGDETTRPVVAVPRHDALARPLAGDAEGIRAAVDHVQAGNGLLDFTDLIDACLRDVYTAPRNPSVIFADEAQDLNKMQLTLIRKWGRRAEYFIVAGDDDQTIYSFTGATPEAMLDPEIPHDHKIILKQSYRVPHAVHGLANGLIQQVTRRQEKEYLPRAEAAAWSASPADRMARPSTLFSRAPASTWSGARP